MKRKIYYRFVQFAFLLLVVKVSILEKQLLTIIRTKKKVESVEYIIVDEADKESLIKNIKSGKGAVIDKRKNADLEKTDEKR